MAEDPPAQTVYVYRGRETKTKTDALVTFILAGGFGIPDIKYIESSSDADMRKALWDEADTFSKVLFIATVCSKYTRPLIFQIFLSGLPCRHFPASEGHPGFRAQCCQRHACVRVARHASQRHDALHGGEGDDPGRNIA